MRTARLALLGLAFKKLNDNWTPLESLTTNDPLRRYFLGELHLLVGLCTGENGLTLKTVSSLYPFRLCCSVVYDTTIASDVRAAMCTLIRELYLQRTSQSSAVQCVELTHSVWDWDQLHAGLNHSCISLQVASGDQWQSVAISGTQWQPVVSSGNQ